MPSKAEIPSDLVRTEYIEFNTNFESAFNSYLCSLPKQANHYELVADQPDRNPILTIDYLKRAFLISGEERLGEKARSLVEKASLNNRAKNSVELLAAAF